MQLDVKNYKWFYRFHVEKLNYDTMKFETSHYLEQLRNAPIDSHIFRSVRHSAMLESMREERIMHVSIYKGPAVKAIAPIDENGIGHPVSNEELELVGYFVVVADKTGSSTGFAHVTNGAITGDPFMWRTGEFLMCERRESWHDYMKRVGGNNHGNN